MDANFESVNCKEDMVKEINIDKAECSKRNSKTPLIVKSNVPECKLNNLHIEENVLPENLQSSTRERALVIVKSLKSKRKTIAVGILFLVVLALLVTLLALFVPTMEHSHKTAAYLNQSASLIKDCQQNSEFLRAKIADYEKNSEILLAKIAELEKKEELCQISFNDVNRQLNDEKARNKACGTRAELLQKEVWDLNAVIKTKNNDIFHLKQLPIIEKKDSSVFDFIGGLFSAGSSLKPSNLIFGVTALFIFNRVAFL